MFGWDEKNSPNKDSFSQGVSLKREKELGLLSLLGIRSGKSLFTKYPKHKGVTPFAPRNVFLERTLCLREKAESLYLFRISVCEKSLRCQSCLLPLAYNSKLPWLDRSILSYPEHFYTTLPLSFPIGCISSLSPLRVIFC